MCGRYVSPSQAEIERAWHIGRHNDKPFKVRYNAAPAQMLPIGRLVDGSLAVDLARWGLIPSWAKDPAVGSRMINARAETVATKPAFRAAFRARRCLVPALGFYEWKAAPAGRMPYYITRADGGLMAFAGLWETWRAPGGEPVVSYTILTTDANAFMRKLHERMPVILEPGNHEEWLAAADPARLLAPCSADRLRAWPVSTRVNSPRNDDAALIEPA
jgi:putative SOS response-associated peptidase YedK